MGKIVKKHAKKKVESKSPGRPRVITRELEDEICERIAEGKSLVSILKSRSGMPDYTTVCRYLRATEGQEDGFCQRYAQARQDQADYLADEMMDIADDGRNDTYVDDKGRKKVDWDVVHRSKLRVDTRKWIASKLKPKIYGDRTFNQITGKDDSPLLPSKVDQEHLAEVMQAALAGINGLDSSK